MTLPLSARTAINGILLTKPEMNLLKKLETKHGVTVDDHQLVVTNAFTGVEATVGPVVAALVRFVQDVAYDDGFSYGGKKVAVSDFDRCRYLIMKLDNPAYFAILD